MRLLCFLITTIVWVANQASAQQWELQSPLPTGGNLHHAAWIHDHSCCIVGEAGIILQSDDGGVSWNLRPSGTSENLWYVTFVDSRNGWAVGDSGTILHTGDGGVNWEIQPQITTENLECMSWPTARSGFIAGRDGVLLKTTDGGVNWSTSCPVYWNIYGISFVDTVNGWMVGSWGHIAQTTNGAVSWCDTTIYPAHALNDVVFVDRQTGWAAGPNSTIIHSMDGGRT